MTRPWSPETVALTVEVVRGMVKEARHEVRDGDATLGVIRAVDVLADAVASLCVLLVGAPEDEAVSR